MKQITRETMSLFLPKRPRNAHKGSFGRVLVVAGSRSMCGAGFLCAKSALASGAGMVFWALPQRMQPAFAAALPEAITIPLPETEAGEISEDGFAILNDLIQKKNPSLAAVGPGMGSSPLLPRLLWETSLPLVVDADALNMLSKQKGWSQNWPRQRPAVFTPHPAEMARLLDEKSVGNDEESRISQTETLCRLTGGISILKGSGTLVAALAEEKVQIWKNTTGGPALAKAGSGDVLCGMISGLWAQLGTAGGFNIQTALQASLCGVYLHGLAGDLAALKRTDYSVLARDTADHIAQAFLEVLQ